MSDKPKNQPKPSDSIEEKSTEKDALNPDVAEKSQTDAKGKGITTDAFDQYAKGTFSKPANQNEQFERSSHKPLDKTYLAQQDTNEDAPLTPNDKPVGGYEQENRDAGGVTLKVSV